MKSRVVAALAGLGLATVLSCAAEAQIRLDRPAGGGSSGGGSGAQPQQTAGTVTTLTPELAVRILQQAGYKGGEPLSLSGGLKGVKMDLNGTPVAVLFVDCKPEGCGNYAFLTGFGQQQVDQSFINAYNRDNRYARVYVMKDGNLTLQMDGFLYGGVTPMNFAVAGAVYANALKALVEFKGD